MWARTGERGKFHAFDPSTEGGFIQLCTEDAYDDLGPDPLEDPPQKDRCKRCSTTMDTREKKQRQEEGDAAAEVAGPPRPASPTKVKVGDQVRAAYLVNGPRVVESAAWVQKVHKAGKGELPRLDLRTDPLANHPSCTLLQVPYREQPKIVLRNQGTNSWRTY